MSNRVLDAFFAANDAKLSPRPKSQTSSQLNESIIIVDYEAAQKENSERSISTFAHFAEFTQMLNDVQALLSGPANADQAAKVREISKHLNILASIDVDDAGDARLEAMNKIFKVGDGPAAARATMRALQIESIKKIVKGKDETAPAAPPETIG